MEEEDVGSLPVVDEETRLLGIVTDRDVALRVVGAASIRRRRASARSPQPTSSRSRPSTTSTRR
jgi:CBS domain-containing protein